MDSIAEYRMIRRTNSDGDHSFFIGRVYRNLISGEIMFISSNCLITDIHDFELDLIKEIELMSDAARKKVIDLKTHKEI